LILQRGNKEMSINTRLTKLERSSATSDIAVWCDTGAEVPATIKAMQADGEITKADIGRCVFWASAGRRPVAHESALAELDGYSE
jgi:hypothetical protein